MEPFILMMVMVVVLMLPEMMKQKMESAVNFQFCCMEGLYQVVAGVVARQASG
jgi:hypothetical protein